MKKYESVLRAKWTFDGASTAPEMIAALERCIKYLKRLDAAGCKLRNKVDDDYAFVETDDPKAAKKFGFFKADYDT